jgi:hypothetical protein
MRLIEISGVPYYDTRYERTAHNMPHPDLTDREAKAVKWWRGHGYSPINSVLRGTDPEWPIPSNDEMLNDYGFTMLPDEALQHLDSIQAKGAKRKRTIKVFRGERSQERTDQFAEMDIGESYVEPGFTSATVGPSYAFYFAMGSNPTNALSMILVPPSVRSVYVSDEEHTEMEVLIDRNTRFTLQAKRNIPNRNPHYRGQKVLLFAWLASR